jgi:hypothetical protein
MSKRILETLVGSNARVKILKYIFRNVLTSFSLKDISAHVQEPIEEVKKEIRKLEEIDLLKLKTERGSSFPKYSINESFAFLNELRNLVLKSSPDEKDRLTEKINKLGRIKLAIISGIFIDKESPDPTIVDMLIVGDDIENKKIKPFLKSVEAEVGKEIKFSVMEKEEFQYRYAMFDRFIRVLFESPHEKLINKLGL